MLSLPIINSKSTKHTRADYLSELQRAKIERVFLFVDWDYGLDAEKFQDDMSLLKENMSYYSENGLDIGIWIGGFGHGGTLAHMSDEKQKVNFTRIRGLGNGGEAEDSFCPADPDYVAAFCSFVRGVALAGAKMIMIDDDLRLAYHGLARIGCACERHMKMFNERIKEVSGRSYDYTREELAEIIFSGEANMERDVWLQLMGDTLREFARRLRREVDKVDSSIRLGHCASLSTWDLDGVDSIELSRIFAGNTKPFLRLIGAPYWHALNAFRVSNVGTVADLERMQFAWCTKEAEDIEVFAEGDVYPRPRYHIPSSYLESMHQVLCAEGNGDKMLKYMIDYVQAPFYEKGYIDRHVHYEPLRKEITDAFANKKTSGIYVYEVMHKIEKKNCKDLTELDLFDQFTPASINFAEACSLPISFNNNEYTKIAMVFGENAKYLNEIENKAFIIDAYAAYILSKKGVDVGLHNAERMSTPTKEHFLSSGEDIPVEPHGCFWRFDLKKNAILLSTYDDGTPAAYVYENEEGIRYLVYAFEADRMPVTTTLWKSYPRQKQLFDALRWLDIQTVPAMVEKEPGLYVLCRKSEDSMAVGIWNFGQDLGLPKNVVLDEAYKTIEPISNTEAVIKKDMVYIKNAIAPYGFVGFVVKK